MNYDHKTIEQKWQKIWGDKGYKDESADISKGPKKYILDMFPYPSGAGLHVGHPEGYTATDIYTRYLKMNGYNVLHPMGWDAFGLPAENYAIKHGIPPAESTALNIETFRRQIKSLGFDYNWAHEVNTSDPEYYKWTQWFFLLLYKNGLAYRAKAPVNWCDSCKTVLANEQVIEAKCERCKNEVIKKRMNQWFFKITDFAEDLLGELENIDWPRSIKAMQENWIGRSVGVEEYWEVEGLDIKLSTFTTWPHTTFGATFIVIAPEHPVISDLVDGTGLEQGAKDFAQKMQKKSLAERTDEKKEKIGFFTGRYAINHLTGWKMPIYIANFAIMDYGTGIVKGCPAHDARDFEFAKKYNLDMKVVIVPADGNLCHCEAVGRSNLVEDRDCFVAGAPRNDVLASAEQDECYVGEGVMVNADKFTGMPTEEARDAIANFTIKNGNGKKVINYKLRDWLVSRQRYWGAPIPIVYCKKCGEVPVPEEDLPVELPKDVGFKPTGKSPIEESKTFHDVLCPSCGSKEGARRESDTMDTFVCSSWYFLRYVSPKDGTRAFDPEKANFWLPVDMYVGGAEHAVLHLLYARFFTHVLNKLGYVNFKEPFRVLRNQGMIQAEDGRKMSKSLGNVINPDDIVREFGADSMRIYEMFMGPLEDAKPWQTKGLVGVSRFLKKVIKAVEKCDLNAHDGKHEQLLQKTIKKVTEDIENFRFNTAVSSLMILTNELSREDVLEARVCEKLVILLSPFAPHLSEELWEKLGHKESVFKERWPEYDEEQTAQEKVVVVVQVNGKVRAQIPAYAGITQEEAEQLALKNKKVSGYLEGKEIKKKFYVKDKILSYVI